ncbi:MAG TPA: ferric reductase-like transmembrane domain-containing protein [Acidimicrobiales bacterium]|nr:ferric reductase-like transmembrane domain-containing protein [Acidimicrobiales bacterium]
MTWYVARSSGLVAWALIAASTLWGLALTTRAFSGRASPRWLLDLHRWLGGLSVVFVGVHLVTIAADTYVHFGWADVFVPFASAWRPADVAWGVVALYLLVAVEVTSLARRRLPPRVWRTVHGLSFPLFVLTTVHILLAGTDTVDPWAQWPVIATTMVVAFLGVARAVAPNRETRADPRGT